MSRPAEFDPDGQLVSTRYRDVYFSGDGAGQARHVFVQGNELPRRFAAATGTFVVAETGFGTGANFLITAAAFLAHAPPHARLVFISTEQELLDEATLQRAHEQLPGDLHDTARALRDGLTDLPRIAFDGGRIVLHVLLGDAAQALAAHTFEADAWFLDGFAPDRNPEMWSRELLAEVAAHSAEGCTLATYTVAGSVRRTLRDVGFACERTPGFAKKREMLRGVLSRYQQPSNASHIPFDGSRVIVRGAGIAGATVARAFAGRGAHVSVVAPDGIASGASGIPAAIVRPRLWIAGSVPDAEIVAHAFRFTSKWLEAIPDAPFQRCGALICATDERDEERLQRRAANPTTRDIAAWIDAQAASARTGMPLPHGAAWIPTAGVCNLGKLAQLLLHHDNIETRPDEPTATSKLQIAATAGAPGSTQSVRGQAIAMQWPQGLPPMTTNLCTSGYLTPPTATGSTWLGSTYDRDDDNLQARPEDDERIRAHLRPLGEVADRIAGSPALERFVGLRQATKDRMPLIGPVVATEGHPPTLATLGHGSRGAATAPWAASLLLAAAHREPLAIAPSLWRRLAPGRFENCFSAKHTVR